MKQKQIIFLQQESGKIKNNCEEETLGSSIGDERCQPS